MGALFPSLTKLNVAGNQHLGASLRDSTFADYTQLTTLSLANCNFSGALPAALLAPLGRLFADIPGIVGQSQLGPGLGAVDDVDFDVMADVRVVVAFHPVGGLIPDLDHLHCQRSAVGQGVRARSGWDPGFVTGRQAAQERHQQKQGGQTHDASMRLVGGGKPRHFLTAPRCLSPMSLTLPTASYHPLAQAANETLTKEAPVVVDLLSERGKRFYFPAKGILAQGTDTASHQAHSVLASARTRSNNMQL
jgi:hypothetical protein